MQELQKILEEIKESSIIVATSKEHYIHPQDGRFVEEVVLLDCVEDIIRKHMNAGERFEFDFANVKSFDCQCGRHYVNTGAENNDGWIPVEERLPEEGGTYIITAKDGEREIISFAKWQNRYKHFDMTGKRAYWRVIAWRPLPEP